MLLFQRLEQLGLNGRGRSFEMETKTLRIPQRLAAVRLNGRGRSFEMETNHILQGCEWRS